MKSLIKLFICLISFSTLTVGCKKDNTASDVSLDSEIESLLNAASNNEGKAFFTLPNSDDYDNLSLIHI